MFCLKFAIVYYQCRTFVVVFFVSRLGVSVVFRSCFAEWQTLLGKSHSFFFFFFFFLSVLYRFYYFLPCFLGLEFGGASLDYQRADFKYL